MNETTEKTTGGEHNAENTKYAKFQFFYPTGTSNVETAKRMEGEPFLNSKNDIIGKIISAHYDTKTQKIDYIVEFFPHVKNEDILGDRQIPNVDIKPIEIQRDKKWCMEHQIDNVKSTWYGQDTLEISLSEALRVIEGAVKYLNQTKNEGRQEIRTLKDKENQKLRDAVKTRWEYLANSCQKDDGYKYAAEEFASMVKAYLNMDIKDL